ncbi:magnesium transporter CorA family protein [Paraferrimonas sedimenticola]|uniref:Magnesium transport protein CorA n=1 Tax=Paraferrimonas sedimenticola TaxID=375674 RepID=A0AA37RWK3_9GAMM|nr:magnesium transporter CorA family protein [Paraferrimonas sedimenticola]GLP96284.1 magnesium transport protein CorA [Paraferrimonas sedimenticola]
MIRAAWLLNNQLSFGSVELIPDWQQQGGQLWLDMVDEPQSQEAELLRSLGCHSLAIADAQKDRRPPKIEEFEQFCFILYRGFSSSDELLDIKTLALAAFIGDDILITRRGGESIGVNALWEESKIIKYLQTPPLLFAKIMNASANRYMQAVLEVEDDISDLEDAMLTESNDELMHKLIALKSHLRKIHRIQSYHVKLVKKIMAGEMARFDVEQGELKHSITDVYDKFDRLDSLTLMYYDLCGDLIEGYISLSSHQLNRTMQLLTVVSVIFVPLTFIAGIYGMNFEYIPELTYKHGYFMLWGFMLAVASALVWTFRRKRWL